ALLDRALAHDVELAREVAAAPDWRAALHELLALAPTYIERDLSLAKLSLQHVLQEGIDDAVRQRSEEKVERWNTVVEEKLARGMGDGSLRALAPPDVTLALGAAIAGLTLMRLTRPELPLASVWRALEEIFGQGLTK